MDLTCYISVSLNKQLIFSETSTKEESVNAVSCFVQTFNDVASTMLKKRKEQHPYQTHVEQLTGMVGEGRGCEKKWRHATWSRGGGGTPVNFG